MSARTTSIMVCAAVALAMLWPAPAPAAEPVKAALTFETGPAVTRLMTPSKVLRGGKSLSVQGAAGEVSIAGSPVKVAGQWDGRTTMYIGLDADGNGTVDRAEFRPVGKDKTAVFSLKLGAGEAKTDFAVLLTEIVLNLKANAVIGMFAEIHVNCAHKGTVDGQTVRLIDDNMDGKITQDGLDAIAVGNVAAMPLRRQHAIGDGHYQVSVDAEGKELTATRLSDVATGTVETSYKGSALGCLMLDDAAGGKSYDVVASGASGIPAGKYQLRYGAVVRGGEVLVMERTNTMPEFEITAGKVNELRIGAPLRVNFSARLLDDKITVMPNLQIMGAGDERYNLTFAGELGRPHVLMQNGSVTLQDAAMDYG